MWQKSCPLHLSYFLWAHTQWIWFQTLIQYCHSLHLLKYRKLWLKLSSELSKVWMKIVKRKHTKKISLGKYAKKAFEFFHCVTMNKWEYSISQYNIILFSSSIQEFYMKSKEDNAITHILWFDILAYMLNIYRTKYQLL